MTNGKSGRGVLAAELLLDTDIFIDHLRGAHRLPAAQGAYSVITRCELFAGRAPEEATVRALLAPLRELGLDRAIAERAGRLRRTAAMGMPDAIIAATAIEHGLALVTRNRRDFESVPGLVVGDPDSLNP